MSIIFRYSCGMVARHFTNLTKTSSRSSSFRSSEIFKDYENHPKVEIIRNPPEWKYVEDLLPPITVPVPKPKAEYYSVWKPAAVQPGTYPYMIKRNKNYMLPVYLKRTHRGLRRLTFVRHIEGNIWELEKELKLFIEQSIGKEILTRVNELAGYIQFRGDYVEILHEYLLKKGF